MSASYGWHPVKPPEPANGFSRRLAGILVEHVCGDDHCVLLEGEELGADDVPFLKGLHAGLPEGDDAVAVRQMIEDIERHGAIRFGVYR